MPSLRLRTRHSVTTTEWWDGTRPIEVWWERIQHATFDIQVLGFSHHKSFCERPRETIEIVWGILWILLEAGCFRHSAFICLDFWISLDDYRLHRQGFRQANPFNYSPVNLLECPPVGRFTSLGSTLKMGFHPAEKLCTSPRNKLINGKIATTNSSSEIFNALLAGRFVFLITHVPLFVTPSVAVTHPIVIQWYVFVHWHQPWWGDDHFAHVRCLTKNPNNGFSTVHGTPSGHLPLRFPESRALRSLAGYWNLRVMETGAQPGASNRFWETHQ